MNTGTRFAQLQAAENKLMVQTYDRTPILFVSGHGCYLTDEQGHDYLDLLSGIGVSALGYAHPAMTSAINAQAAKLIHTSNLFYTEHTAELALRLTEISGLDRAFFSNSGTEAWEAALKLARAFASKNRAEGGKLGTRFLALEHSFHGRTMGSVATTYKERYRTPFAPVMPEVDFVPFNDVDALRTAFAAGSGSDVCAILIEAIQGEGGIHPVSMEFFAAAKALCDSTGALLIADEIQCGFGRTGRWFGYQHFGIVPDVVTIAKPLAGGLPIGALLATERAASAISPGMHGTTFGGGPLITAVAVAVIDEIKHSRLLEHVTETGTYFLTHLRELASKHPAIREIRGKGLMIGLDFHNEDDAKSVAAFMLAERILINRTSETVLRFLPPYMISAAQLDVALDALDRGIANLTHPAPQAEGERVHG